jgi:hypothetical protein
MDARLGLKGDAPRWVNASGFGEDFVQWKFKVFASRDVDKNETKSGF